MVPFPSSQSQKAPMIAQAGGPGTAVVENQVSVGTVEPSQAQQSWWVRTPSGGAKRWTSLSQRGGDNRTSSPPGGAVSKTSSPQEERNGGLLHLQEERLVGPLHPQLERKVGSLTYRRSAQLGLFTSRRCQQQDFFTSIDLLGAILPNPRYRISQISIEYLPKIMSYTNTTNCVISPRAAEANPCHFFFLQHVFTRQQNETIVGTYQGPRWSHTSNASFDALWVKGGNLSPGSAIFTPNALYHYIR